MKSESTFEQAERKRRLQLTRVKPLADGEESSEVPLIITMAPAGNRESKESLLGKHLRHHKSESSDIEDPLHLTHVVVLDKNSPSGSTPNSKATLLAKKSPTTKERKEQSNCPRLPDTLGSSDY